MAGKSRSWHGADEGDDSTGADAILTTGGVEG